MSGKPTPPATYARVNPQTNLVEVLDIHTGRVLCVQHSPEDLLGTKWDRLTRIDTPEGPVFIEKGINFDITRVLKGTPYSEVLADLICQKVVEGFSLVEACRKMNLEYSTLCRWKRENEAFKERLAEARRDRAEALHDEMLARARRTGTSARTHIEALQYSMERGDPEQYAPKQKLAEVQGNITFMISTGISRELPPGGEAQDVTPKETPLVDELPMLPGDT